MLAFSVARLTFTSATPSSLPSVRSTRPTQLAQVIPCTPSWIFFSCVFSMLSFMTTSSFGAFYLINFQTLSTPPGVGMTMISQKLKRVQYTPRRYLIVHLRGRQSDKMDEV